MNHKTHQFEEKTRPSSPTNSMMNAYYLPNHLGSFMWHFLKPYKKVVCLFILLALLAGFWGPFNSLLLKAFINTLAEHSTLDLSALYWIAGLLVINFLLFDNVTWRTLGYLNYKYEAVIKNQIVSQTFSYVMGSSHQFFQDNLSGRIADQIKTLADNLELIMHRVSVDFLRGASLLIVSFVTAYCVNILFFYILLLWFIAFSSFSIWMSKRLVLLSDEYASAGSQLFLKISL